MKKTFLRDGTAVEFTISDTHSGPDGKPGCQRTSINVAWFRVGGGPWERHDAARTIHRACEIAEASDNVLEFRELLEIL